MIMNVVDSLGLDGEFSALEAFLGGLPGGIQSFCMAFVTPHITNGDDKINRIMYF